MRRYLQERQRAPGPWTPDRRGRRGTSLGGAVADRVRLTLGGQARAEADDPRYYGAGNDGQIRRDRTAYFSVEGRSGVGTAEVDWTACGPYRPELNSRNVTVRRMAGTDQTRAFANPLDPTVGLHTNPRAVPVGNFERYKAGAAAMRGTRTDRLSPARYTGQSWSQTTLLQGARR